MRRIHDIVTRKVALIACAAALTVVFAASPAAPREPGRDLLRAQASLLAEAALAPGNTFVPEDARPLMNILHPANATLPADWEPPDWNGATGGFCRYTVQAPLERILSYAFSPTLPGYIAFPATVRRSGPLEDATAARTAADLAQALEAGDIPTAVYASEFEESAPSKETGAWYRYSVRRMHVLLEAGGAPALLSVSVMPEPSEVGKKGARAGEDSPWMYVFLQKSGLMLPGLGWVNSRIDQSMSIHLLTPAAETPGATTVTMLRWAEAGWAGANVLQTKHLVESCRTFASGFKAFMESGELPPPEEMAERIALLRDLDRKEMLLRLRPFAERLRLLSYSDPDLEVEEFSTPLRERRYLESLSDGELESELIRGYVRSLLGR